MEYSCESFLNYTYDGEIAVEMFKPIQAIVNVVQKLFSILQRLFNNLKRLRKIQIPKDELKKFAFIDKQLKKCEIQVVKCVSEMDKTSGDEFPDELIEMAEDLSEVLDVMQNSPEYIDYMSAEKVPVNAVKSDYYTIANTNKIVSQMNNDIKWMAKFRGILNRVIGDVPDDVKKCCNVMIRYYRMRINMYSKLFTFRKPRKDPEGVNKLPPEDVGSAAVKLS